ncbi:TIGR04282 family arsenosugar biosynthesis glycosyltransferase [Synechococcus sp. CS-205]|uniref:TIGR04282 family arsenosugar biosynthesis glycosyltransferase n=1 Tax=Synechococcus sp. CS-205 TaxID=2847984 RepID=UPI00223B90AA|nr:TIGR04282 family arsenosugar biosynthesis glycosyltransferase [Synechococcus sp. CS-205]
MNPATVRRPWRQVVVMARWPARGRCKSRLGAGIGLAAAARIQRRLSEHTLAAARPLGRREHQPGWGTELVLAVGGLGPRGARRWGQSLGADRAVLQGGGGLGSRMVRQLARACREGARQVLLIGTDLPLLATADLESAFAAFASRSLVLGPASDGGYWLIGLTGPQPGLFSGIPWGSADVLRLTLERAQQLGLEPVLLAQRQDLDRPGDLEPWLG